VESVCRLGMRDEKSGEVRKQIEEHMREMKSVRFKLGELFCGPGGLGWGAHTARVDSRGTSYSIEHAWAVDYDQDSCETYRHNICPENPDSVIRRDVRQLDINTLSPIDAFAYGFPCNDFSVVGEQKGFNGSFGPLYTYGIDIIDKFHPQFFLAENVSGIKSANDGAAFQKILSDLQQAGYGYNLTIHLFKFEEYGIPQARHRVIIVGIKKSIGLFFRVPAPTTVDQPMTAREALEDPPIPAHAVNQELTNQAQVVVERLRHIKPGENAWNASLPEHLRLNVKHARLSQIYKRLDPEAPAYTITGSGGGGTHCYHWKYPRALTNRERARIQTFPDSFVFKGSKESVRRQIGMAVSPRMSQIIFSAILKMLAGTDYPSVTPNIVCPVESSGGTVLAKDIIRQYGLANA